MITFDNMGGGGLKKHKSDMFLYSICTVFVQSFTPGEKKEEKKKKVKQAWWSNIQNLACFHLIS